MLVPARLPILMYHRLGRAPAGTLVPGHYVTAGMFRRHLLALSRAGFISVSLQDGIAGLADSNVRQSKPIAITFDDGYESFRQIAAPALTSSGFTATVFLVSDLIGQHNRWDADQGDVREDLMSEESIRDCLSSGMTIGSHTATHARLTDISVDQVKHELRRSREGLSERFDMDVNLFAYPYGAQDATTRKMVKEAGYRAACSTLKGVNGPDEDPFALRRFNVRRDTWTPLLLWKLRTSLNR